MSAVLLLLSVIASPHAEEQYPEFHTRLGREGVLTSDHEEHSAATALPDHCDVGVAGAGFSGIYFAWRLGIELGEYDPKKICIFEMNGRLGGRIYTVREGIKGLHVPLDVGGYRAKDTDLLPYDLITKKLLLHTQCYDYLCDGDGCEGVTCHKVTDAYGNSQYALAMEIMLGQLKSKGAQIFFGVKVTDVRKVEGETTKSVNLIVERAGVTHVVHSGVTMLNTPLPVFKKFPKDSVVGSNSIKEGLQQCIDESSYEGLAKTYVVYKDAWWYSKLGKMQGLFGDKNETLPLSGRYHDGPVRCVVGEGADGKDIFANDPVPFGKCTGALLAFYDPSAEEATEEWSKYQFRPTKEALSVVTRDSKDSWMLLQIHLELMEYHKEDFAALGVDPMLIELPESMAMGTYTNEEAHVGAVGYLKTCNDDIERMKEVRRPNAEHDVFLANVDFGLYNQLGWAVGGLELVEKVIQAELNLAAPEWLDASYYKEKIFDRP